MEVIDFNDMEHFAYQLLQDPMIKEEMYNKYQMILVDEFQDISITCRRKIHGNMILFERDSVCLCK